MDKNLSELIVLIEKNIEENNFVKAIFSRPISKTTEFEKVILSAKKVSNKNDNKFEYIFQSESFKDKKAFHKNFSNKINSELQNFFENNLAEFKSINIFTKNFEYIILANKNNFHVNKKELGEILEVEGHDKKKNYIIKEGEPVEFLIDLGVMDKNGQVNKNYYNKFRQINKYLEFISDVIDEFHGQKEFKIIDFGSGKSYLTFALYYYMKFLRKLEVEIIGLDLKQDVIDECSELAKKYKFDKLEFLCGDIKDFSRLKNADIIFSLHACDNATDFALTKGLELGAKAILAVPCCQHEFNEKISGNKNSELSKIFEPIISHGILKENLSALLTDAFRGNIMELCGYKTQIIEFINMVHTPKNILIKCIRDEKYSGENSQDKINNNISNLKSKKNICEKFINFIGIEPQLYGMAKKYFIIR
ncbi:MAG: class I SAM-dependent methyltransferase [Fusobacteriaceae bacterium]